MRTHIGYSTSAFMGVAFYLFMRKDSITQEQFIEQAQDIHNNKYDYSKVKYVNKNTKVCIICPKHGEFWQTPSNHLMGKGCILCAGVFKKTTEQFISDAVKKYGNKYDYSKSKYTGANIKLEIICPEHGEFWQTPAHHLFGEECPECSKKNAHDKQRKTLEQFISEANLIHNNKYDYSKSEYVNYHTKLEIICPKHGSFWQEPACHISAKEGCPECKISKGENKIAEILNKYNIKFEIQKKFSNCCNNRELPFDFYLPDYNLCIEYQGGQHFFSVDWFGGKTEFDKRIKNDAIKKEWCFKEENPKLLEITFEEFDNVEEILIKELKL